MEPSHDGTPAVNGKSDTNLAATLDEKGVLPSVVALLTPVAAIVLERLLWRITHPHVWFPFYPAVFLSVWLGGPLLGLIATAFSTILVCWFFLRPERTRSTRPNVRTRD